MFSHEKERAGYRETPPALPSREDFVLDLMRWSLVRKQIRRGEEQVLFLNISLFSCMIRLYVLNEQSATGIFSMAQNSVDRKYFQSVVSKYDFSEEKIREREETRLFSPYGTPSAAGKSRVSFFVSFFVPRRSENFSIY